MALASPILSAFFCAALTIEAQPLVGEPVRGELKSVDIASASVETADGPKSIPLKSLKSIRVLDADGEPFKEELNRDTVEVRLADGTRLMTTSFLVDKSQANVQIGSGIKSSGPSSRLSQVRFQPIKDPELASQWDDLMKRDFEGDCLAFTRQQDNQLVLSHLDGAVGDVGAETIDFKFQGESMKPKRAKVLALVYLKVGREMPSVMGMVRLTDGSELAAAELSLGDSNVLVKTAAGWEFDIPSDQVASFEFGNTNLTFLADLKPTSVDCEPYFGVVLESERAGYLPRMNQDHRGQPLKLAGKAATSAGVALRSQTKIVYRFTKSYNRLMAQVGIAEYAATGEIEPHLVLKISSDKKVLFNEEVAGTDAPIDLDLDLKGVQRLTIEVQYGKSQDIGDVLHFCNARLTK